MATTNQLVQTLRLDGNTVAFGSLAQKNISVQTTIGEIKEITETIKVGDLDREFDFSNFQNGEAVFFFIHIKDNPVALKINGPANQSFIIPAGGVMMLAGQGIASVNISGQVSGDAIVYMQAAGTTVT